MVDFLLNGTSSLYLLIMILETLTHYNNIATLSQLVYLPAAATVTIMNMALQLVGL